MSTTDSNVVGTPRVSSEQQKTRKDTLQQANQGCVVSPPTRRHVQSKQDILLGQLQERLAVLFWQERTCYQTVDYIELLELHPCNDEVAAGAAGNGDILRAVASSDQVTAESPSRQSGETTNLATDHQEPNTQQNPPQSLFMREQWREVMCEWAYNLVDHFDLPRERVSICMNLVDRYLYKCVLSEAPTMNKRHFQLLSLTCLYLSIKLDGFSYISIDSMVQLARGMQRKDIVAMEQNILFLLDWKVHPPTPYIFIRHYLLLLNPEKTQLEILELAKFYLELSVLDYQFVRHKPSRIAMAALLNAIQDRLPTSFSKYYHAMMSLLTPNDMKTVQKCRKRLYYLFCSGRGWDDSSSSETSNHTSSSETTTTTTPNPNESFNSPVRTGPSPSKRLRLVT